MIIGNLFSLGLERCANCFSAGRCGAGAYGDLICRAVLLAAVVNAILNVAGNTLVVFALALVFVVHHNLKTPCLD